MIRRLVAGLIAVGLAIGVWALWPRGEPDPSPTTTVNAVASTTTTMVANQTTTSTTAKSHVVTTVEEAEAVLRQLWFGWFEGIYNQDEERIREVVTTQGLLDDARRAFGTLALVKAPEARDITFASVEILLSDETCLVIWTSTDLSAIRGPDTLRDGVDVLRWTDDGWRLASAWALRNDLWEADCGAILEPLS